MKKINIWQEICLVLLKTGEIIVEAMRQGEARVTRALESNHRDDPRSHTAYSKWEGIPKETK